MSVIWISSVGIVFGWIGAILLYRYGFPVTIDLGGFDQDVDPPNVEMAPLAKVGIAFISLGFACQLLANGLVLFN